MIYGIFKGLCPNCGGDITIERLELGLPCETCLPSSQKVLKKKGELFLFHQIKEKEKEWIEYFEQKLNSSPWGLQIAWAKRVFLRRSFALLAPTGVGKTTFGISMSAFLAKQKEKSYIILPTKLLVEQVKEKLKSFGISENQVLSFGEKKSKNNKERLQKGDFLILITTSMFLYKNIKIIPANFSFLFVDDVDSFLKSAKNIDKVLLLLGFTKEDIEKTLMLIKLKQKIKKSEDDWQKITELTKEIKELAQKVKGTLVVSSATSKPKSNRVRIFKELLGFEIGSPIFYLRNVIDSYTENNKDLIFWIKKFGKGGLIFVPSDKGKDAVSQLVSQLNRKNIKAVSYDEINEEILNKYENGEIDVIVGISSYRNPLARGVDLPHVIRYAIFYGVPKIVIPLKFETNFTHFVWALASIRPYIAKNLPNLLEKVDSLIEKVNKYKSKIETIKDELEGFFTSPEIKNLLENSEEITLRKENDMYQLIVSDITGYLQASGRTSRMFAGNISKGLSLIIVDDKRAFNHLLRKIKWFNQELNFIPIEKIDLKKVIIEIDEDRKKIKSIREGKGKFSSKQILNPVFIIVESPNKARTIANFFGKPIRRRIGEIECLETSFKDKYLIISASFGHILDLSQNGGIHGVLVDEHVIPIYEPIKEKNNIIDGLKKIAQESFEIFVATDPDTEGEKIGWDIKELLTPFVNKIARMEFHEVTKNAIIEALNNPRKFNENLVKAQIVRRISDRWIGFEFSQFLWKVFGQTTFSAGRVQTPVLGWIIKREAEYKKKIYKIAILIAENNKNLAIDFAFDDYKSAKEFFRDLNEIEIEIVEIKDKLLNPYPPYRTDTLLKHASDKYHFSLSMTMSLLQSLFENGFITYHRTDSIRVSNAGLSLAKEFIYEEYGKEFFSPRTWAQGGAHECIRPTKLITPEEFNSVIISSNTNEINKKHFLIYKLIFDRFIASQMKQVKVKEANVKIKALDKEKKINFNIAIIENGWNLIYPIEIHPLITGKVKIIDRKKLKIQPKAYLYTQGELVNEMKVKGIGRPSTYATIIEKLFMRNYIKEKNGFIFPTPLGKKVFEFLNNHEKIKKFISEDFTRELEKLMDEVEEAKIDYEVLLKDLFKKIQLSSL